MSEHRSRGTLGESTAAEAVNDMRSMSQEAGTESGPQGAAQAAHTEGRGTHTGNTQACVARRGSSQSIAQHENSLTWPRFERARGEPEDNILYRPNIDMGGDADDALVLH